MSVERGVLSLKRIILLAEIIVTSVPQQLRVTFLTNLNILMIKQSNFIIFAM